MARRGSTEQRACRGCGLSRQRRAHREEGRGRSSIRSCARSILQQPDDWVQLRMDKGAVGRRRLGEPFQATLRQTSAFPANEPPHRPCFSPDSPQRTPDTILKKYGCRYKITSLCGCSTVWKWCQLYVEDFRLLATLTIERRQVIFCVFASSEHVHGW